MKTITEQLDQMRNRLGLYICSSSVAKLAAYLKGYNDCLVDNDIADDSFLTEFQKYVEQRYGLRINQTWDSIIQFVCLDGSEQIDCFWMLYDEYIGIHQVQ